MEQSKNNNNGMMMGNMEQPINPNWVTGNDIRESYFKVGQNYTSPGIFTLDPTREQNNKAAIAAQTFMQVLQNEQCEVCFISGSQSTVLNVCSLGKFFSSLQDVVTVRHIDFNYQDQTIEIKCEVYPIGTPEKGETNMVVKIGKRGDK